MAEYLAFLRGINVGGKALIKMAELKAALEETGFDDVHTYIQSGNVFVSTSQRSKAKIAKDITTAIDSGFDLDIETVVFTKKEWTSVVQTAPKWWGKDAQWKHNLLILLPPFKMSDALKSVGTAVEKIEYIEGGTGVVYASTSWDAFTRSTIGKLAAKPVYKRMTVRNYNTATKLLKLFR